MYGLYIVQCLGFEKGGSECEFTRDCSKVDKCRIVTNKRCVCKFGSCVRDGGNLGLFDFKPECKNYLDCACNWILQKPASVEMEDAIQLTSLNAMSQAIVAKWQSARGNLAVAVTICVSLNAIRWMIAIKDTLDVEELELNASARNLFARGIICRESAIFQVLDTGWVGIIISIFRNVSRLVNVVQINLVTAKLGSV